MSFITNLIFSFSTWTTLPSQTVPWNLLPTVLWYPPSTKTSEITQSLLQIIQIYKINIHDSSMHFFLFICLFFKLITVFRVGVTKKIYSTDKYHKPLCSIHLTLTVHPLNVSIFLYRTFSSISVSTIQK